MQFSAKQDGHKYGIPTWWTVYANETPIHHWATKQQAEHHANLLNQGVSRNEALSSVQAGASAR